MALLVLFNKPMHVLSQFTDELHRPTLRKYIPLANVYPAGRLDFDSEGLLVLTDHGRLQAAISQPKHATSKTYWVQVEGCISKNAINKLRNGVVLRDGLTKPAIVQLITEPEVWQRNPPVRFRKNIPTSWIAVTIKEGRNRQVRRMKAAVGYPTLRLIRSAVGHWNLDDLALGQWQSSVLKSGEIRSLLKPASVNTPTTAKQQKKFHSRKHFGNNHRRY